MFSKRFNNKKINKITKTIVSRRFVVVKKAINICSRTFNFIVYLYCNEIFFQPSPDMTHITHVFILIFHLIVEFSSKNLNLICINKQKPTIVHFSMIILLFFKCYLDKKIKIKH